MSPISNRRATRRRALYVVLGVVVLIILFMILVGRREDSDEVDAMLANPNVMIGKGLPVHDKMGRLDE